LAVVVIQLKQIIDKALYVAKHWTTGSPIGPRFGRIIVSWSMHDICHA